MTKLYLNSMLTKEKLVNDTLYIIKVIKDYRIASFNTSNFS